MTRENKHQAFWVGSCLRLRLRFMALNLHFLPISTSETKENLNPPRSRQPPKEKRSAAVGSKSEQNIIFISHFHLASRIALSPSLPLLLFCSWLLCIFCFISPAALGADLTVLAREGGGRGDCLYLYARVRQGVLAQMRVIGCH